MITSRAKSSTSKHARVAAYYASIVADVENRRRPQLARWCYEQRERIAHRGLVEERINELRPGLSQREITKLILANIGISGGSGIETWPQPVRYDMWDEYFDPGPRSGVVIDTEAAPYNGNFQLAWNAARHGDIVLVAEATVKSYGQNYRFPDYNTVPVTPSTPKRWNGDPSYIIIKSKGAYPTNGTRVTKTHENTLARLNCGTNVAAIVSGEDDSSNPVNSPPNAPRFYRFEGFHFRNANSVHTFSLVNIGQVTFNPEGDNMVVGPNHIMFVACFFEGNPNKTWGSARAIQIKNSRHIGIFDSTMIGIFHDGYESHCITGWSFRGLHVVNTQGQGMTEGMCLLGSGNGIARIPAEDIIFDRCFVDAPITWMRDLRRAVWAPYGGTVEVTAGDPTHVIGTGTTFATDGDGNNVNQQSMRVSDYFAAVGFRLMRLTAVTDTLLTLGASYPTVPPGTQCMAFHSGRFADGFHFADITVNISGRTITRASGSWRTGDDVVPGPVIGSYFSRTDSRTPTRYLITGVTTNTITLDPAGPAPGDATNVENWFVSHYDGLNRGVRKWSMEFKTGRRVEVTNCVFDLGWEDGGTHGGPIVINNSLEAKRMNSGSDIRVSYCWFKNHRVGPRWQNLIAEAFSPDVYSPSTPEGALGGPGPCSIEHCLTTGIHHPSLDGGGAANRRGTICMQGRGAGHRLHHCTYILAANASIQALGMIDIYLGLIVKDNILFYGDQSGGIASGFFVENDSPATGGNTDGVLTFFSIGQENLDRNLCIGSVAITDIATNGRLRGSTLTPRVVGGSNIAYGNAAVATLDEVGFVNSDPLIGTWKLQPLATRTCTISGSTVTITAGGALPATVRKGTGFKISTDGAEILTSVLSVAGGGLSATLAANYPGATSGQGVFTFQETASDKTDPGVDYDQLTRRLTGVREGLPSQIVTGRPNSSLAPWFQGKATPTSDGSARRTLFADAFERRLGTWAWPSVTIDIDCDTEGWEEADAPTAMALRCRPAGTVGYNGRSGRIEGIKSRRSVIRVKPGVVTVGNAQWARAQLTAIVSTTDTIGPAINISEVKPFGGDYVSNGVNRDAYIVRFTPPSAVSLTKMIAIQGPNLNWPTLTSISGLTIADGDEFILEHDGVGNLKVYQVHLGVETLILTYTDPAPLVGGTFGIHADGFGGKVPGVGLFSGGDFGAPAPPPPSGIPSPITSALLVF